jgi:aspartate aminotransferase
MTERTVIVDGFSKTYAMTGWRLGYAIMPEKLADRIGLLLTHAVGCTATFTQYAGIAALEADQDDVEGVVSEYQDRRDTMVDGLNSLPGISCLKPQGAFYVFPNITSIGLSSKDLASRLLDKAGVAVLPGTDFGDCGEGYLRLCYAASIEKIESAVERIREFLKEL